MNVPAIAQKTFVELRSHAQSMALVQIVLKKLKKINFSKNRAQLVHKLVDDFNSEVFSNPVVQALSPCKKGCTACCHTQVSVTEDEASLLAERIQSGAIRVNLMQLRVQAQARDLAADFYAIPYADRRCVFLTENGACSIYEDRPSVCRSNAVLGPAEQCDTSQSVGPVRLVKTPKADLVTYASFLHARSSGSLAYMLSKALGLIDN